jgi:integrase
MASVINRPNGHRWIQFSDTAAKRQTLRLGKTTAKTAAEVCRRVELLLAARIAGTSLDRETAAWLTVLSDGLRTRFAELGLIDKPEAKKTRAATLGPFLKGYLATRTDIKPRTKNNLEQSEGWLVEFFGANRRLSEISQGDADEFRRWLLTKVGDNTARRHCGRAKQFFRAAVRKKLIAENPFGDMKACHVTANKSRDYFVTLDESYKVLDACPDTQWKLLFALSRIGGLRCPSEPVKLKWGDVDWERNRLTIHSPKTEHHEGKETRVIPIFPELRPYLEAAWAEAPEGSEYVITLPSLRRDRYANVGTMMARYVRRAGLKPWPKLFHNMRATRETELAKHYPMHVVCEWIGNSKAIAAKHYLRVTDSDYSTAVSQPTTAGVQNVGEANSEALAKQNAKQHTDAQSGMLGHAIQQVLEAKGVGEIFPAISQLIKNYSVPPTGFEPVLPD